MENKIKELVLDSVHSIGEMEDKSELLNPTEGLRLFGGHGVMDSIGIVMLITEIEEQMQDELDILITLADDRAMSQKTSPFRSVKSLIKYITTLVNEQVVK